MDHNENIYIADTLNNRIRMVDAGGTITTIAGNGLGSYSGDGGPAVDAALKGPIGVAKSPSSGHVYIADTGNYCIRKVDADTGDISTYAGIPTAAGSSGDGIQATAALLNGVTGVTVDHNEFVYINEERNNRIRVVDPGTGLISTITGTGSAGFSGDDGPAIYATLSGPSRVSLAGIEPASDSMQRLTELY